MRGRYGNFWAQRATNLLRLAHRKQPHVKWLIIAILTLSWIVAGLLGWLTSNAMTASPIPTPDAIYKTLGALTVQGSYENAALDGNIYLQIARFAGVFVPLVGLLFAFSGQLGRGLASLYMNWASRHIVICGGTSAALSLARGCVARGDAVALIASALPADTAWSLRQSGVILYESDESDAAILQAARAAHADHFVCLSSDDPKNLRTEATLRSIAATRRRSAPLAAHIAIGHPQLLLEAREMRATIHKAKAATTPKQKNTDPVDSRPFSLAEIAARQLIGQEASTILGLAESQNHQRPHLVFFGFERSAELVAVRALMSLWSVHFGEPRITVLTPDPVAADAAFAARYPQSLAHDVWKADIAFVEFDWRLHAIDSGVLEAVEADRGAPTAVVIDTLDEATSIQLAFALMRTANIAQRWLTPIYLNQDHRSEFTEQFASGDATPTRRDSYIQAFGMVETTATPTLIIDALLDRGAAAAHLVYQEGIATRDDVDPRKLEALGRSWDDVPETYRAANRASADAALVKLWDFGWRPAGAREKAELNPTLDQNLIMRAAEVEHRRWNAERLLSGWRPGAKRDNAMMVHDNIVAWRTLDDGQRAKDVDQIKAALKVARILFPRGFVRDTRRLP